MSRYSPPEQLNLADYYLADRLREGHGERIALRLPGGDMTYREVEALAQRFAHALRAKGVRREERVLVALPDGAEFVGALFGVLKLGAVVVMLNPDLSREEAAGQISYVRPTLAVVSPTGCALYSELIAAKGEGPGLENGLLVAGDAEHPESWQRLAPAEVHFPAVATHRDDPAIWLFSGGTTGRPKAVVQPHRSFANTTELYAKNTLLYRPDDITISVPKLYFGYATGSNLFFPFSVGASCVLFPEPPTPELLFKQIARYRPSVMVAVPTVLQRMADFPGAAAQDLSCLRCVTSAGEALPPSLYQRFFDLFGVELLDGLGTAEMWHIFLTNRPGEVHPGTLGRAVEGFEVSARDEEGKVLPAGEVGRLWVRGDSRAHGYWQNLEKTVDAFRGEYFVGGDLIRIDQEGVVTYCGRADDVFKVAGRWLVPAEVEDLLLQHPEVAECAVIGAAGEGGLVKPYAFVLAKNPGGAPAGLEESLKAFALEKLAAYKHPRRVLVLESFPRTHLGKVDRGALRAKLKEALA
jgi:benzoate-CoA ligase family protein